jgi:hypothetical protein
MVVTRGDDGQDDGQIEPRRQRRLAIERGD